MKNVIYLFLALLVLGCEKEAELTSKIEIENLYGIQDDPSDPVKHRIFEIYNEYGVPVYFNDTIGRVFVKNDVTGNAVYRYETLDLAWNYSSYDDVTYEYEYMTDPDEQMIALGIIENYLEMAPKVLYPFNFFVTESAKIIDANDEETVYDNGSFTPYFRTVLMTGNWTDAQLTGLASEMKLEILKSKIVNYQDLLTEFNEISDQSWYFQLWSNLDPDYYEFMETECGAMGPYFESYFNPAALSDSWPYSYILSYLGVSLSEFQAAIRAAIGKFGFVNSSPTAAAMSPASTDEDLVLFITEMLRYSKEEFEELWGECPLVMSKYEILYDVITNKLGIEL